MVKIWLAYFLIIFVCGYPASIADEPMDGEWTLTVEDRDVGPIVREGVLNSWGIEVKETLVERGLVIL